MPANLGRFIPQILPHGIASCGGQHVPCPAAHQRCWELELSTPPSRPRSPRRSPRHPRPRSGWQGRGAGPPRSPGGCWPPRFTRPHGVTGFLRAGRLPRSLRVRLGTPDGAGGCQGTPVLRGPRDRKLQPPRKPPPRHPGPEGCTNWGARRREGVGSGGPPVRGRSHPSSWGRGEERRDIAPVPVLGAGARHRPLCPSLCPSQRNKSTFIQTLSLWYVLFGAGGEGLVLIPFVFPFFFFF